MQKNILIDLNVILDVLLERKGFDTSQKILELSEGNDHRLHISAHMVTTFAYLLESASVPNYEIAHQLSWLLGTFSIIAVDHKLLEDALKSKIKDYEDAVVEQAAIACNAAVIITRNIKDFQASAIQALTPEVYFQR